MNQLAVAAALLVASTSVAFAQGAPPAPPPPTTTTTTTTVVVSPAPTTVVTPVAPGTAAPAATAPAGQPQNHDWNNVNNINGQLVKVGETNDYLKTYRRWNISTNPIGMILGFYGVSVSYGINNNIAIRGDINYMNPAGNDEVTGVEVGVGIPIYFRRTYQGLFLEPGLISRTYSDKSCYDYECSSHGDVTSTTFGPQMLVGWHWTWDSGLNFALAAGAGRDWSTKDTEYNEPGIFANGYMRFGYAF